VYDDRKKTAQNRLDAVVNYVTSDTKCRNKLLLEYFDENQAVRCKKCDVCLRRNKEEISQEEFDGLHKSIQFLLEKGNLDIDALVKKLPYPESKIIHVVRWMLDNELIKSEDNELMVS